MPYAYERHADQAAFDQAAFDQAAFDQAAFDQAAFDQAAFDQAAFDQVLGVGSLNRIFWENKRFSTFGYTHMEFKAWGA
jgi:hypothetical protein